MTTIIPLVLLLVTLLAACATTGTTTPGTAAEAKDMRLVGHEPLQGRSAYQPLVVKQGERWIAYVGHHGGERTNALTGRMERNGTREAASFIPAVTAATARRCVKVDGTDRCKVAIQTNNVEVDDRGGAVKAIVE